PFVRGHFQGKIVGYLIVMVLPILLTEGAGAIAEGVELAAGAPPGVDGTSELFELVDASEVVGELSTELKAGNVAERLLASNKFPGRLGLGSEPFEGGFTAIEDTFNPYLDDLFPEDDPWGGFQYRAEEGMKGTKFDWEERTINFARQAGMNKFSVAEEVQHAIDYTLGARSEAEIMA